MVATRNRLPTSEAEETDTPAAAERKRKIQNALKKLEIDGLGPMKGEQIQREEASSPADVYHYRGAIYEKIPGTREEWVEQQPERYRKRKSSEVVEDSEDEQRPRKVVKGDGVKKVVGETLAKMIDGSRKRARSPEADEDEEAEQHRAKRPRRSGGRYDVSCTRPRNLQDFTPNGRRSKRRRRKSTPEEEEDRMHNSREYDHAVIGGHDDMSCIEHARRRAEMMGYAVAPFSKNDIAQSKQLEKSVGMGLFQLVKVNSQIAKTKQALEEKKAALADQEGLRMHPSTKLYEWDIDVPEEDESVQVTPASQRSRMPGKDPASIESLKSSQQKEGTQEPTPPSEPPASPLLSNESNRSSNEPEIITERPAPSNTTHVNSKAPAPLTPDTSNTSQEDPFKPSRPTGKLPKTNKAGQILRWSLPENITNADRAEQAIYRGRLPGETKEARRRRVKREFALVKSWKAAAPENMEDEEDVLQTEDGGLMLDGAADIEAETVVGAEVVEDSGDEEGGGLNLAGAGSAEDETALGATVEVEEIEDTPSPEEVQAFHTPRAASERPSPIDLTGTPDDSTNNTPNDSSSSSGASKRSSRLEKYKTKVCQAWMEGACRRGERCTYKHEMD